MPPDHAPMHHPFRAPPAPGTAVEVAQGVLWLRLPLPMALDHVNIYALDDGPAGWTLVDTGLNWARGRAALEAALAGPLAGRPVHRVILTHHHPDHVGLAGWLQAGQGSAVWATQTAWLFARMLTLDAQPAPTPEHLAFWRAAGMDPAEFARRAGERPFNFADCVAPLALGFTRLGEGDTVQAGGRAWTVRLGQGHAPDQITLWSDDGALVIGADQLLPGISPNLGVYPTEPEADPVGGWLESCARLATHATEAQLVLPGHKLPFTGLPFRLAALAQNHHEALARLHAHLARPATACEVFALLFKRSIGPAEYGHAMAEAVAHMNHLWRAGRLRRWRRADGAWLYQQA